MLFLFLGKNLEILFKDNFGFYRLEEGRIGVFLWCVIS